MCPYGLLYGRRNMSIAEASYHSFLLINLQPRVEWYTSLWALNTSPPWNGFTFLRSSCSWIENCTGRRNMSITEANDVLDKTARDRFASQVHLTLCIQCLAQCIQCLETYGGPRGVRDSYERGIHVALSPSTFVSQNLFID